MPKETIMEERLREAAFGLDSEDLALPLHLLVNEEITGRQLLAFISAEVERGKGEAVREAVKWTLNNHEEEWKKYGGNKTQGEYLTEKCLSALTPQSSK